MEKKQEGLIKENILQVRGTTMIVPFLGELKRIRCMQQLFLRFARGKTSEQNETSFDGENSVISSNIDMTETTIRTPTEIVDSDDTMIDSATPTEIVDSDDTMIDSATPTEIVDSDDAMIDSACDETEKQSNPSNSLQANHTESESSSDSDNCATFRRLNKFIKNINVPRKRNQSSKAANVGALKSDENIEIDSSLDSPKSPKTKHTRLSRYSGVFFSIFNKI